MPELNQIDAIQTLFAGEQYIADRALALTVKLAGDLQKPIDRKSVV